jgi:hypothetical protein
LGPCFVLAVVILATSTGPVVAAPVDFVLDPVRSTFRLGGTFNGTELGPQMPNSDVTGYTGTLVADINRAAGTLTTGTFIPRAANQPVDQQPLTNFPGANYGLTPVGTLPIFLAARGMDLWVNVTDAPYNTGAGEGLGFFVNGGTLYYSTPDLPNGGADLHGYGGAERVFGQVTLVREGDFETLTIPIQTRFTPYTGENGDDIVFTLAGQLVATRIVPEPGGLALLLGSLALLPRGRHRGRRPAAG